MFSDKQETSDRKIEKHKQTYTKETDIEREAPVLTRAQTHICAHTHTHRDTPTHKYTHTHTHARPHRKLRMRMRVRTNTHMHTHTHTRRHPTHTHTHTYTHTHTHTPIPTFSLTHTHTYTLVQAGGWLSPTVVKKQFKIAVSSNTVTNNSAYPDSTSSVFSFLVFSSSTPSKKQFSCAVFLVLSAVFPKI